MARRAIVGLAVLLGLFATLSAQLADPGPSRHGPFSFGFHNSFGHDRHGFFGRGHGFGFGFGPFFLVPRHFGFRQPFVFGGGFRGGSALADPDGFRFHAGPDGGSSFFFDPYYYDPFYGYSTRRNESQRGGWDWFVEEWGDKDPAQPQDDSSSGLEQSLLLREGMDQEEVMRALGSPIRRVTLGTKEVLNYSGYSLVFEGGALKEMR